MPPVYTPLYAGGWASYQIFKNGGGDLAGFQFLEWGCWERGVTYFWEGESLQFLQKK